MEARDISSNIDESVSQLKAGAQEVMDKVSHATSQAVETLSDKGEQLQNFEQRLVKNCRGYIHDNPVTSIGIAVGVGFLISRLLKSR